MRRVKVGLALMLIIVCVMSVSPACAEEESGIKLTEIEVKARTENGFVERKQNETATQTTLNKEAITLSGGPAQTSILKAIELAPSVYGDSSGPYPDSVRVRGQAASGMSIMVEGVPIWAVNGPGPRPNMFDLENFQSITLYRGGTPPDKGLGAMNAAGVLDINILKPADAFGVTAKQAAGSYGFLRSFLRVDSGKLPTGTKFFVSGSTTSADKWKGKGSDPEYREHVSLGAEHSFSSKVKAEFYADYNNESSYNYKKLTHAQVEDLSTYGRLDYNWFLTGNAAQDRDYYEFNQRKRKNLNMVGTLSIAPTESTLITFKPYYWTEDFSPLTGTSPIPGTTKAGVLEWKNDGFDRYGGILEYKASLAGANVKLGYWYESFDFPMPNIYYELQNGHLVYNRTLFSDPDERGTIHSPYVRVARDFAKDLHVDLGLRYLYLDMQGTTGRLSYSTATNPNLNYSNIIHKKWLPYLGASYSVSPNISVYASYGRNYAFPSAWPGMLMRYIKSQAKYEALGVNMQYLADQTKLMTSDNYELGLRFNNKEFYVTPVVFYTEYQDRLISVYDPVVQQSLHQSVGKTRVYGAELEVGVNPLDNLTIFASFSYNKSEIMNDFETAANAYIQAKGNDTPDTPQKLAKFGLTYNLYGLQISPIVQYIDSRYGDAMNTEKVPSYWLADLNVNYKLPVFLGLKEAIAGICVQNLFDEDYISTVSAGDNSTTGSYGVGAPRRFAVSLSAKF